MRLSTLFSGLLNVSLAFAAVAFDSSQCDNKLCYKVTSANGGYAHVVDLNLQKNSQATSVSIPSYVQFGGKTYYVNTILDNAFKGNSKITDVTFASGISKITIKSGAFSNCSNLKRVVFSCQNVAANLRTFENVNKDIRFQGRGTKSFVDDQVSQLLTSLRFSKKTYNNRNQDSVKEKRNDLFELGKTVYQYLRTSNIRDGGSVATIIKVKFAENSGYCRLFRLLAIAMGVPSNEIFVATDGNGHYWNIVKIGTTQFLNVDINFAYRVYSTLESAEKKTEYYQYKNSFKSSHGISNSSAYWKILRTNYGYADESNGQQTMEYLESYLKQNKLGEFN